MSFVWATARRSEPTPAAVLASYRRSRRWLAAPPLTLLEEECVALPKRYRARHARLLWGVAIGIALAAAVMLIIQYPDGDVVWC